MCQETIALGQTRADSVLDIDSDTRDEEKSEMKKSQR